jgi:hypothetical protein
MTKTRGKWTAEEIKIMCLSIQIGVEQNEKVLYIYREQLAGRSH